ncbi:SET and MYND domain-containing protein 5 [Lithohypha guttulata]|uniref:SET and MYND domain-containing protein 5 n=1 Tax=Lithohypha guttulata TaxID=1690604 RepID=UPI002DE09D55|nr:hypothetical protein LTR51_000444 [Lithohypha guttulata]
MDRVEIGSAGEKGEGLFARQFIPKGEVVMILPYPIIMAIEPESLPTTCYGCLASVGSQRATNLSIGVHSTSTRTSPLIRLTACVDCSKVWYCGKSCEVRAWDEFHQYECEHFDKMDLEATSAEARAVIRLLLLEENGWITSEAMEKILKLHKHEAYLTNGIRASHQSETDEIVQLLKHQWNRCTVEQLLAIVHANSFNLRDDEGNKFGLQVHAPLSKANHSCRPNACFLEHECGDPYAWTCFPAESELSEMSFGEVRATKDIQEGHEVTISYLSKKYLAMSFQERMMRLHGAWLFYCKCTRCKEEKEAHNLRKYRQSYSPHIRARPISQASRQTPSLDITMSRGPAKVVARLPAPSKVEVEQNTKNTFGLQAEQLRITHNDRRSRFLSSGSGRNGISVKPTAMDRSLPVGEVCRRMMGAGSKQET